MLPHGDGLLPLLAMTGVAAVLANLVNNLPATLVLTSVIPGGATARLLAMLIGVNVGPNLTYTGSLATLLWRRVVRAPRSSRAGPRSSGSRSSRPRRRWCCRR